MLRVKGAILVSDFRHGPDYTHYAWGDGCGSGGFNEALGCNMGCTVPLM